ncbi:mandelate racemase/muconate lactonizing enzyme family protein [Draconibacterium sediminis]|uniref:Dipeptide epimerase n=1 Tax=Draconibacterium sediminis TaxID=1544798 RepID=A0A0D8J5B0_9BACT|nr:dipeptide epimerase [Draconibacterium sediminis]KJF41939.1 mandelate racemase [Draconibacterium sediminis]
MKHLIDKIDIYQSPIKLKEPFVISLGPMYHAQNVIVVIHTNHGITGFGECSPFMTINGESMETCFIVGQYLAQVLKGENPEDIEACTHAMDKTIYGNSSIKSAFDMALYDISAQKAGVPLYQFLGGQNNKEIQIDYTVSLTNPEKMAADAKRIIDNGFEIIKVKLGHSKEQDVESIKKIREAIGPKIPIRIDANQGWKTEEALDILKALTPYKIQHCEEPIPRWDYMALPEIRRFSPIPIMADETCCDHIDAKRLIDLYACDLINIKLSKSGGIFKALKIVEFAKAAKMEIQVGGFLETRLGFTAAAHFALSSKNIVYYDFDTPLMMEEDPVEGGILYGEKGKITITETPGLGASIKEDFLLGLKKISV